MRALYGQANLKHAVPSLLAAMDEILQHPSKVEDTGTCIRTGKHLVQRTVNTYSGSHEWSMPVMASALLGENSIVFPHANVSYVDSLLPSKSNSSNDTSHDPISFDKDDNEYAQSCLDAIMAGVSKNEVQDESCGGTTSYKMADGIVIF